jgi:hypothetical protein
MKALILALLLNAAQTVTINQIDADEEATYLSLMEQHHHHVHKNPKKDGDGKMIKKKDFDTETGKVKMVKKTEHH